MVQLFYRLADIPGYRALTHGPLCRRDLNRAETKGTHQISSSNIFERKTCGLICCQGGSGKTGEEVGRSHEQRGSSSQKIKSKHKCGLSEPPGKSLLESSLHENKEESLDRRSHQTVTGT